MAQTQTWRNARYEGAVTAMSRAQAALESGSSAESRAVVSEAWSRLAMAHLRAIEVDNQNREQSR